MPAARALCLQLLLFTLYSEVNAKSIAKVPAVSATPAAAVVHRRKASIAHTASVKSTNASANLARTRQPFSVTVGLHDSVAKRRPRARSHHGHKGQKRNAHGKSQKGHVEEENAEFIDSVFSIDDVFQAEDPGLGDEEYHYKKVWNVIKGVRRHKHKHRELRHLKPVGVQAFFGSAVFYEWCIFALALSVFFPLFWYLQDWPSTRKFHIVALFIWIALGALYNLAVWTRLGRNAGVMWFTGYLLEFIFSIENVFIFHIVVKAFRTPQRLTQKAIFIVICCQIVFEMIFFMGLAARVRSMEVLPYLLGVWLLYVGYHAGKDDGYDDFNIKDSAIFRLSHWVLGRRLMLTYEENGSVFLYKDRRLCVSLLFPLICCLLAVDFFLEVDVTLTKIEELPNEYIAFTSSAAAAFAVPELFFVARDLFQRFFLLKYGVSFVLVFFGVQMLMHRFCDLPDLVGCAIIIIVMIVCMVASSMIGSKHKQEHKGHYDDDEVKPSNKEPAPEPPCKDP